MNPIAVLVVLLSLLLAGCDLFDGIDLGRDTGGGARVEYARTHPWIGKCARFELPMVYLTNLPPETNYQEVIRIGQELSRADDADYLRRLPDYKEMVVTPVSPGTTFEVAVVFMLVHTGLSSIFNSDFEVAVLKDNNGLISTGNLSELKPCN